MREYKIKVNNGYKVIYTDSDQTEIKEFQNITELQKYINIKECLHKGKIKHTEAQKKFAAAFPDKLIDCDIPAHVDIDKIIEGVKQSEFFRTQKNITLASCIKHYDKIINGGYKDYKNIKSSSAVLNNCYSKEQLSKMFTTNQPYEV